MKSLDLIALLFFQHVRNEAESMSPALQGYMISLSYIGAIDQGTSSTRFSVFQMPESKIIAFSQEPIMLKTPQPGYVVKCPQEKLVV